MAPCTAFLQAWPAAFHGASRKTTSAAKACKAWLDRHGHLQVGTSRDTIADALQRAALALGIQPGPPQTYTLDEPDPSPPTTTAELAERWLAACDALQDEIGHQDREIWLKPCVLVKPARLWAPNRYYDEWVADNYRCRLSELLGVDLVMCTGPPETMLVDQPDLPLQSQDST